MRLGSSIQNHLGPGVVSYKKKFFSQMDKFMDNFFSKFQKHSNLHERCVMCWTEWKAIFRFLWYWVFEIWLFLYSKRLNFFMSFEYKIDHNSKLKIAQGKLIFQTFQFIAHLPLKWEQNWGDAGLHILS